MTFRGLEIWDLGIIGLGFVNLGISWGLFLERAIERNGLGTCVAAPAHGPSTEGAGTRVCGHVIKEE